MSAWLAAMIQNAALPAAGILQHLGEFGQMLE